jgi:tRNA uridine 5-carboxymethylaminomethyl modification enzyme
MQTGFDVIVIGGGHAGCEAALAAARLGASTLLLTINNDHLAQMSCNPAVGGIAKGQVVREIDALGGEMGLNTDAATIQFRMLNRSKGAAVQSPRAQCDKVVYQKRMKLVLERQPNLLVQQARVARLETANGVISGVTTEFGETWPAKAVVLATGTFLNGTLHYGLRDFPGGRAGDPPSVELSRCLREDLGLEVRRLKTGTPPRVLGRTIDLASLQHQDSDEVPERFSDRELADDLPKFHGTPELPKRACYVTRSTARTAEIIRTNLDQSPMYSGRISGTGTRYCPSFEDKVIRFPHHETHQIHIEPEGIFTDEYYLNGISTSLPPPVQWQLVRSLPGLEQVHITRYAYAIEYDFVPPFQLHCSLAAMKWPNLFLAGQINGTSGYEEAAGQGLVAGLNAARLAGNLGAPVVLGRDQAYIGVMIDDLVTKEITEPYRLFTSRAEYRLQLRHDNAALRLTRLGHEIGLVGRDQFHRMQVFEEGIACARAALEARRSHGMSLWELLHRPEVSYDDLPEAPRIPAKVAEQLKIEATYYGYIDRQIRQAAGLKRLGDWRIPDDFDYSAVACLRAEARQKLSRLRPGTLGQASRIDGVTPPEIALLQVMLRRLAGAAVAAETTDEDVEG